MLPLGSGSVCGATIPLPLFRAGDPVMSRGFASIAPLLLACCGLAPPAGACAIRSRRGQTSVWLRALHRRARGARSGVPELDRQRPGKTALRRPIPRRRLRAGDTRRPGETRRAGRRVAAVGHPRAGASERAAGPRRQLRAVAGRSAFCARNGARRRAAGDCRPGLTSTPFSLEHIGPAWTPEYALSASALDNWLWEEISLAGIEGEWWHAGERGPRLGLVVGAGFGPDQLGRLLALRGWVDRRWTERSQQRPAAAERHAHRDLRRARRPARCIRTGHAQRSRRARRAQGRLFRQPRRPERRRLLEHALHDGRRGPASAAESRRRRPVPGRRGAGARHDQRQFAARLLRAALVSTTERIV